MIGGIRKGDRSVRIRYVGRLAAMEPTERADLLREMGRLWTTGLQPHIPSGSDWPRAFWDSAEDRYAEEAFGHVAMIDDEVVGYELIAHRRAGRRRYVVVYATAVRADLQGANIGFALTTRALLRAVWRERTVRVFLVSRVFNPVAMSGVYRVTPDRRFFYPAIDPAVTPNQELVEAVHQYVETFYPSFDWEPGSSLISSSDEKTVPPFQIRSGNPLIDDWWDEHLPNGGASVLSMQESSVRLLIAAIPLIWSGFLRVLGLRSRGARIHDRC